MAHFFESCPIDGRYIPWQSRKRRHNLSTKLSVWRSCVTNWNRYCIMRLKPSLVISFDPERLLIISGSEL